MKKKYATNLSGNGGHKEGGQGREIHSDRLSKRCGGPHHRAPLRTTVLFHGALHPRGLFQSVLMGLDASYTGHEAKYLSVSRFEVFIAGLAILSSAHLSQCWEQPWDLMEKVVRRLGASIPFTLFSFHSSPLLLLFSFLFFLFFFRLFGYSDRSFFLPRLYRAKAF